jgi:hypothetical protein
MIISYGDARQEAREILQAEQERMQRLKAQQDALRRIRREEAKMKEMVPAKLEEQTESNVPSQAKPENLSSEQSRPKRSLVIGRPVGKTQMAAPPVSPVIAQSPGGESIQEATGDGMIRSTFKSLRHKASASNASSRKRKLVIGAPMPVESEQVQSSLSESQAHPIMPQPMQSPTEPPKSQAFDAPISAVNAGERRVFVRYNNSSIALPVTPTTRAQDLLNSASVVMSETIDPKTAVLVESFTQLGLERPIRRYEHIRDVLNSWDHDEQNVFVITPHSDRPEGLLEMKGVPKFQPKDTSFIMYHSQKPGKWNKRCINLRTDGQMTVSKKEGDSDATNICHLSDFDIYGPTHKQMKKIKSPKKICFVIKSQQKSSMFLDSAAMNFVHFVCTSDWQVGDSFYLAIQSWRSWYLVNKLGEGQKMQAKPANAIEAMQRPGTSSSGQSIPYQLGSFQPLLDYDLGQLDLDLNSDGTPKTQAFHRRNISSRDRRSPPSAFPSQRMEEASAAATVVQRDRAPSINGRTGSLRSNVVPTNLARSSSLKRGNSTRQKPQPMIDLTPTFKEAPQHIRIGRGVKAPEGQRLVDLATDVPQEPGATNIPSATDWRRPDTRSPTQDEQAFTGMGLLGRSLSRRTQGASRSGHGVRAADGKPLVDLSLNSKFADGSLLRQVEAWSGQDERGLIVDREKRIERSTKVGEGF